MSLYLLAKKAKLRDREMVFYLIRCLFHLQEQIQEVLKSQLF